MTSVTEIAIRAAMQTTNVRIHRDHLGGCAGRPSSGRGRYTPSSCFTPQQVHSVNLEIGSAKHPCVSVGHTKTVSRRDQRREASLTGASWPENNSTYWQILAGAMSFDLCARISGREMAPSDDARNPQQGESQKKDKTSRSHCAPSIPRAAWPIITGGRAEDGGR